MSNAAPISIAVPVTPSTTPGLPSSVQNLGAFVRVLVYVGPGQVEIWTSLDGVNLTPLEITTASGGTEPLRLSPSRDMVRLDDRGLFYACRRVDSSGAGVLLVGGEDVGFQLSALSLAGNARNVGPAVNVNLAAFTVAGNDGVTNVAGDVVVLYAQTDPTENGPWVVGAVVAGVAALTRPIWWASGSTLWQEKIDVAQGTVFIGTEWKTFSTTPFVVDAADPVIMPLVVAQRATLVNGTVDVTNVPIRSATLSTFVINRITPIGTALTVEYNPTVITPGPVGTALLTVEGQIAAGTINAADQSILSVSVING